MPSFDEFIAEALAAPFQGWDFSFLDGRSVADPLPWDYPAVVAGLADNRPMLDLGTGGGEILAGLAVRPARTVATEAWVANVPVAARRLVPLGIPVIRYSGARGNLDQGPSPQPARRAAPHERLPFRDGAFGLVTSRHESFQASEVARVLAPGGWFVTQQVDLHWSDDFRAALDLPLEDPPPAELLAEDPAGQPVSDARTSWLPLASQQVRTAGLVCERAEAAVGRLSFLDIGALAYYLLKAVPWLAPEVGQPGAEPALRRLHEELGDAPFSVREPRFLLVARKP